MGISTANFLRISLSPPRPFAGLGAYLRLHLNGGVSRVHLRFPGCDIGDYRNVLEGMELDPDLEARVSLSDHFGLLDEYPRLGVHLSTSRRAEYPEPRRYFGGERAISTSTHSPAELASLPVANFDYAFLGPVYPSISKPGYGPKGGADLLTGQIPHGEGHIAAVALGGIEPERLAAIRRAGFAGAAMLGGLWRDLSPEGQRRVIAQFTES